MSLDDQIARIERTIRAGDALPELYLQLGRLYMRAGRPEEAHRILAEGVQVLPGVVDDASETNVADLAPIRFEILEAAEEVKALLDQRQAEQDVEARRERLERLVARLEREGLSLEEHDALIREQVACGLAVHAHEPACPACRGPMRDHPDQDGALVCARSGEVGDLCRHTDARNLFACTGCGLVGRAWNEGRLAPDPNEPPLLAVGKARCELCQGGVADWHKHFRTCPKAPRPGIFPRCDICRGRGFHQRPLHCPRCKSQVMVVPCMERKGAR